MIRTEDIKQLPQEGVIDETSGLEHVLDTDITAETEAAVPGANVEAEGWTPSTSLAEQPAASDVRQERRGGRAKKFVVAVMAGMALAACSSQGAEADPDADQKTVAVRTFDQLVQDRVVAGTLLLRSMNGGKTAEDKFDQFFDGLDQRRKDQLTDIGRASTVSKAEAIAASIGYYPTEEEIREAEEDAKEVTDPQALEVVNRSIQLAKADKIAAKPSSYSSEEADPAADKQELAAMAPDIAVAATRKYEAEQLDDIMNSFGSSYKGISYEEALQQIQALTDPAIRQAGLDGLEAERKYEDAPFAERDYAAYNDARADLTKAKSDASSDMQDLVSDNYRSKDELSNRAFDAYRESDSKVTAMLAEHSASLPEDAISDESMRSSLPLDKMIDFSTVDGGETVPDDSYLFGGEGTNSEPKELNQFAEVFVEGGIMQVRFAEGSGLSPEAEADLRQIFDDLSPFFREAFHRGVLNGYHFVTADSMNGSYGPSRDAYGEIPQRPMSVDALRTLIVHEITHGLTGQSFDKPTPELTEQLGQACASVRAESYILLEYGLGQSSQTLDSLRDVTPVEYRGVIEEAKRLVDDRHLGEAVTGKYNQYATDCLEVNSATMLRTIAAGQGMSSTDVDKLIRSIADTPEYLAYHKIWTENMRGVGLYNLFNEGQRVESDEYEDKTAGHSNDNGQEFVTSIDTSVILYDDKFVEAAKARGSYAREAISSSVSISLRMMARDATPEFRQFLMDREQKILSELGS